MQTAADYPSAKAILLVMTDDTRNCDDVAEYLDYANADGDISNYYPDFLVKLPGKRIVIVETKGQEDLDVPQKIDRLQQWCEDINRVQPDVKYDFVYVDQESLEKFKPASFRQVVDGFSSGNTKAQQKWLISSRKLDWKEEKAVIDILFDIGLKQDVIFSPLFVSGEEWDGGIFARFPVYEEILRDGAIVT